MPKIIIHAPKTTFDSKARQAIAAELTNFALECEALPKSPFVKSTVWTYFNDYSLDSVFMGESQASMSVVSMEIFVIEGGLDDIAKKKLIQGATSIIGRQLGSPDRVPVYLVIHEIPEINWGIFGTNADLAALRASAADAPALSMPRSDHSTQHSQRTAPRIGIAGTGKMGSAIAARLRDSGKDLIVWNRSSAKAKATGLPVADSPRMLAQGSDVVISSLFDESAIDEVYRGTDGLLKGARGKLFIEMSTVRPGAQQSLAESVVAAGGAFIECPVGGTTGPARSGQLLGLAGGAAADIERARPLLEVLCRRVEHMGPVGSGALAKLAINLPLLVFWQSFGEALTLVSELKKDPEWLIQLFTETAGGANVLKVKANAVAATLAGDDDVAATFDIDAMRKDLRMMLGEARARGTLLPAASQTLAAFDDASAAGLGRRDCAYVPAYCISRQGRDFSAGN